MRSTRFEKILAALALTASVACAGALAQTAKSQYSGIGTTATKEDLGNLVWTAGPSGKDLPAGSGTAKQGYTVFIGNCSMCHGTATQGVPWAPQKLSPIAGPRLSGGKGTQGWDVWAFPFPEVLFNTVAVEMPMYRPGTLTVDQVYAVTAFILYKNGLIKQDDVMNKDTLPKVKMPNWESFPKSDEPYMNMDKRGCYKTYGVCMDQ